MKNLKIGDYVRTKNGIAKINYISNKPAIYLDNDKVIDEDYRDYHTNNGLPIGGSIYNDTIVKSSPNIIDLIELKDILKIYDEEYCEYYYAEVVNCETNDNDYTYRVINYEGNSFKKITDVNIKRILTHEQFEERSYKL